MARHFEKNESIAIEIPDVICSQCRASGHGAYSPDPSRPHKASVAWCRLPPYSVSHLVLKSRVQPDSFEFLWHYAVLASLLSQTLAAGLLCERSAEMLTGSIFLYFTQYFGLKTFYSCAI